jgi:hypothetical protein
MCEKQNYQVEDAPDRRESYLKEAEDEEERKNVKSGTCLV